MPIAPNFITKTIMFSDNMVLIKNTEYEVQEDIYKTAGQENYF